MNQTENTSIVATEDVSNPQPNETTMRLAYGSTATEATTTSATSPPSTPSHDDEEQGSPEKEGTSALGTSIVGSSDGEKEEDEKEEEETQPQPSLYSRLLNFYVANEFLILVIGAILLARAYPPLGAKYLAPEITATWIAVCIIFVLAGLGLKTDEFSKAFQKIWKFYVQCFNFGFVSLVVYAVTRALESADILSQDLADGLVVSASLPMTINMVLVLTKASGGDESLAIVNAAAGNLVGVFLSPILILGYLGVTGDVNLVEVFYKLALRVVLPVALGQVIQKTMPKVVAFNKKHKKHFKKFQEYCLVFIVYTVFCRTFEDESDSSIGDIFLMILFVFLFLVSFMAVAWVSLGFLFSKSPEMRVMGLFGCTHKTVAMGVPLINAIYEDNSAVGLYTLPLLIWHPMQLVIGTFLAPRLAAFVERENIRLGQQQQQQQHEEHDITASTVNGTLENKTNVDLEASNVTRQSSTVTFKDEPSELR